MYVSPLSVLSVADVDFLFFFVADAGFLCMFVRQTVTSGCLSLRKWRKGESPVEVYVWLTPSCVYILT